MPNSDYTDIMAILEKYAQPPPSLPVAQQRVLQAIDVAPPKIEGSEEEESKAANDQPAEGDLAEVVKVEPDQEMVVGKDEVATTDEKEGQMPAES